MLDGRLLVREVHVRVQDNRHLFQRLLYATHATSAGHPRDAEGGLSHLCAVPRVLYRPHELLGACRVRIVSNGHLFGGEVHAGLGHAIRLRKSLLDPGDAGGARHPGYWNSDQLSPLAVSRLAHLESPRAVRFHRHAYYTIPPYCISRDLYRISSRRLHPLV